jgi:hypothetical protein
MPPPDGPVGVFILKLATYCVAQVRVEKRGNRLVLPFVDNVVRWRKIETKKIDFFPKIYIDVALKVGMGWSATQKKISKNGAKMKVSL